MRLSFILHQLLAKQTLSAYIALLLLFPAWKVKKTATETPYPSTTENVVSHAVFDTLLQKINDGQIDYTLLSLRCKTVYDDGSNRQQFNTNIRIKKDSMVWVSLTGAMGIEGARLAITRDSFFLLNKLSKEYTARPISFLNEVVPLNTNLQMLQSLLLASPVPLQQATERIFHTDSFAILQLQNAALRQTITVLQQNYTTREIMLADQRVKQDLRLTFGNYRNIGEKLFPFERNIKVNRGPQQMNIEMEVQRYTINEPLTFPFEVNESYKKN